eukprot:2776724-Rhodomonas_salina.1
MRGARSAVQPALRSQGAARQVQTHSRTKLYPPTPLYRSRGTDEGHAATRTRVRRSSVVSNVIQRRKYASVLGCCAAVYGCDADIHGRNYGCDADIHGRNLNPDPLSER